MIEAFVFQSRRPGPNLLVLGGVHGDEVAGTVAINRLISGLKSGQLQLLSGTLTLAPVCNPRARAANTRQTEDNLNRVIRYWENPDSYEKRLGCEIAGLIDKADDILDLHSTHCPGEDPFAFMDYPSDHNMAMARCAPVDFILVGWPDIYGEQSAIDNFSTEAYAHKVGKNGITVECGYHRDENAGEIAYSTIRNYMTHIGMLDGRAPIRHEQKFVKIFYMAIKDIEGRFVRNFKHMDSLKSGEPIIVCENGNTIRAPKDSYIILPQHAAKIGTEWYYLGELYS